ncbi:hypothetical protein EVAR_101195_1 [Eumeta japonica]|uniref:Uncharacterized protein n=1 Tax=Eumeta variegata TaxID=151549 RepID=A0A4C1TFE4_EUMVA|nr:hypothetical protein EVAR_101195_1 [Eumeta japonica]
MGLMDHPNKAFIKRISSNDATISDGNMFMASVVPLRLKSDVSLHWKNPRPSSVHYCRPIMFQFAKESAELIRTTVKDIEEQISKIKLQECKLEKENILNVATSST